RLHAGGKAPVLWRRLQSAGRRRPAGSGTHAGADDRSLPRHHHEQSRCEDDRTRARLRSKALRQSEEGDRANSVVTAQWASIDSIIPGRRMAPRYHKISQMVCRTAPVGGFLAHGPADTMIMAIRTAREDSDAQCDIDVGRYCGDGHDNTGRVSPDV